MTQVHIALLPAGRENGRGIRLAVLGHAGYGEKGRDIVCAAESILVQALACTLAKEPDRLLDDFSVEGVPESGCAAVTAWPTAAGWERIRGMYEETAMGFCLLAHAYPANVAVAMAGISEKDEGAADETR